MSIYLGNLTTREVVARLDVAFPEEVFAAMDATRQDATNVSAGRWHCFDIPFAIVCGDIATATFMLDRLAPFAADFKVQIQIMVQKEQKQG